MTIHKKSKKEIEKFFNEKACYMVIKLLSDQIIDYEQRIRQCFILQMLEINEGDIILDAGCGYCRDSPFLIKSMEIIPGKYLTLGFSRQL